MVLAYLSRGDYFGEIGLLGGGMRTATCTALDHVEAGPHQRRRFPPMIERIPRRAPQAWKPSRTERRADESTSAFRWCTRVPLDQFLSPGPDGSAEPAGARSAETARAATPACAPAPTRTTASRAWSAKACASITTWSPRPAASAAIRSAWSAARSARSAAAIRWK